MKKLFTLTLSLLFALTAAAQATDTSVQFCDKDGNIIADGTTLTLTQFEEDFFGNVQMPSGLFVKNTTDKSVHITADYTISSMSSGTFQICFPQNCVVQNRIGTYATEQGDLAAGALRDMQTEWFPTAVGSCNVSMKIVTYKQNAITKKWNADKYGPTVTLNFVYGTSSIADAARLDNSEKGICYDLMGRRVSQPAKGLYIVNGRKVIVK